MLLKPSTDDMRPTHAGEGSLPYSEFTRVNANLILKTSSGKPPKITFDYKSGHSVSGGPIISAITDILPIQGEGEAAVTH